MANYAPTTPTTPAPELDCDLLPFLGESPIGLVLKAPLVFMVPYLPELAAIANRSGRAHGGLMMTVADIARAVRRGAALSIMTAPSVWVRRHLPARTGA